MKVKTKLKKAAPQVNPLMALGDLVACDTECTGLNTWKGARPFAFSFCNPKGKTAYISFPVDPFTREVNYDGNPAAYKWLKEFFAAKHITKVFWNAKFDIRMCQAAGIRVRGTFHEGIFAAHACNSDELTFALKPMAKKYCGIPDDDEKELKKAVHAARRIGKRAGWTLGEKAEMDYWMPAACWRCGQRRPDLGAKIADLCKTYAVRDAERTMVMWLFFEPMMEELEVADVYRTEMKLWHVVNAMEERGVYVSSQETKKLRAAYLKDRNEQERKMRKWGKFNPRSPKQMQAVLYDKLRLKLSPHGYRKKKTERSCDVEAMMELSAQHPLPDIILRWKAADKAIQFCDKYETEWVLE